MLRLVLGYNMIEGSFPEGLIMAKQPQKEGYPELSVGNELLTFVRKFSNIK